MLNATQGFHQRCFVCFTCGKDFPDSKFSMHEGNTYHREVRVPHQIRPSFFPSFPSTV